MNAPVVRLQSECMQALTRVIRCEYLHQCETGLFISTVFSCWLQKYIVKITEKETYIETKQNKAEDG